MEAGAPPPPEAPAPPPAHLKTETIRERVQQGLYTLFPKENMRSIVWQSFRGVVDERGAEVFGVCCCLACHTCIRYKSLKNGKTKDFGTKNLRDHMQYCGVPRTARGRREKRSLADMNHAAAFHRDVADIKMQLGSHDVTPDAMIKGIGHPGDRAGESQTDCSSICKVESLEDDFLDQINKEVSRSACQLASQVNSLGESTNTTQIALPKHDNAMSTSCSGSAYKRIRVIDVQPLTTSHLPSDNFSSAGYGFSSSSSSGPSEVTKEDEHDIFGRHVANELRSLPSDASRRWARFQIQKVFFEAHSCEET